MGTGLSESDRMVMPDWVKRSSLPAYIVSGLWRVVTAVIPIADHYLVPRAITGTLMAIGFWHLATELQKRVSALSSTLFTFLCMSQFHIPFYSSRLLVNTFGLLFSLLGIILYLRDPNSLKALGWIVFSSFALRLDLFPIAVGLGLDYLIFQTHGNIAMRFLQGVSIGTIGLAAAALVAVPLDSLFWSSFTKLEWAELSVILFNVFENKSHMWGVSPWHWYVTNALPRAIGPPIALLLYPSRWSPEALRLLLSTVVVPVSILSLVGHKELRFIFPSIVALTVVIAIRACELPTRFRRWILLPLILANAASSSVRLVASATNYPGGEAWEALSQFFNNGISLSPVILPGAARLLPSGFLQLSPPTFTLPGLDNRLEIPSCSIYNGYLADTTGYTKYFAPDVPCRIVREGDTMMDGVTKMPREERERFTIQIVDMTDGLKSCDHPVSAIYGFDSVDVRSLKLVLKPVILICHSRGSIRGVSA